MKHRRMPVAVSAVATILATLITAPSPAAGAPAAAPAGPTSPGAVNLAGRSAGGGLQATITLITGDRVQYSELPGGRASATVLPKPGGPATYRTWSDPTGLYVVPRTAEPLLAAGQLDQELFDVQYLARNGYADDRSPQLPVIVTYPAKTMAKAAPGRQSRLAAPGATKKRDLPSVDGESLAVDKARASSFWSALRPGGTTTRAATPAVGKVWLDVKVHASLDTSVPLVGAPQAWASGLDGSGVKVAVIDTGIDANHPDLRGKVVAGRNFTPDFDLDVVQDDNGHGTHVASTIVGSGAAAGGRYRGVAPGANLLVAKVLNSQGFGDMSAVIAGMEWAAANGAKVVNLSLGIPAINSDGLEQAAVEELSNTYNTLFVIAAGNSGPEPKSLSSPGVADSALTVAATTKADALADFSSRGPRANDYALKPDIAAPGVGIVAARAAGTSMGKPVDANYTSASGTSMATPHVVGAAAILAQQHPDWSHARLKAALMSTAKEIDGTPYERGAGRLDIARAVRQQVTTSTANLDFRRVSPEDVTGPVTKEVEFVNPTAEPVTLDLTANLRHRNGQAAPAEAFTVDPSVTVPAGGTATATVRFDVTGLTLGRYSGSIVATGAGDIRLSVPVGGSLGTPLRKLSVEIRTRPDTLSNTRNSCAAARVDDQLEGPDSFFFYVDPVDPSHSYGSAMVPTGRYHVECDAYWAEHNGFFGSAMLVEPEVDFPADTTLTFDLAKASPVTVDTPRASEAVHMSMGTTRTTESGTSYFSAGFGLGYGIRYYATPTTTQVTTGKFRFSSGYLGSAPQAVTTVHGRGTATVSPKYPADDGRVPKFTTDQRLALANYDDLLAGRDVRGKLVILVKGPGEEIFEEVQRAAEAGAAGVLNYTNRWNPDVGSGWPPLRGTPELVPIPVLWLDGEQWAAVAPVLDGASEPYVDIRAQTVTPYEYKLTNYENDRIPDSLHYRVRQDQLATVDTDYHLERPAAARQPEMWEGIVTLVPEQQAGIGLAHDFDAPISRTEYYNLTGPDVLVWRTYGVLREDPEDENQRILSRMRGFSTASRSSESLNQAPASLSQLTFGPEWNPRDRVTLPCIICRQEDRLYLWLFGLTIGADRTQSADDPLTRANAYLERDGVNIPLANDEVVIPHFPLSADPATYKLRLEVDNSQTPLRYSRAVTTDWTFQSSRGDTATAKHPYECGQILFGATGACLWQPLIQLGYGVDLALDNTAEAGRTFGFTVTASQLPATGAGQIAGMKVWTSYDDGAHWTPASVKRASDGEFGVSVRHPELERTTGAVSLKVEAWDTAGNRVTQRIDRAYGLRAGRTAAAQRGAF